MLPVSPMASVPRPASVRKIAAYWSPQQAREFATRLGWELVPSPGKSRSAVRSVDLDDFLVDILNRQRELQRFEARTPQYVPSDFVFTTRKGGSFHPMSLSRTLAKRSTAAGLTRLNNGPRAPPHQRHPDARQRCTAKGDRGTPGPRRRDTVHGPLQPRNPDHATRRSGQDRPSAVRP